MIPPSTKDNASADFCHPTSASRRTRSTGIFRHENKKV
jgi:hypothetical protein